MLVPLLRVSHVHAIIRQLREEKKEKYIYIYIYTLNVYIIYVNALLFQIFVFLMVRNITNYLNY